MNDSGFSRHMAHMLRYFFSLRLTPLDHTAVFPAALLLRLHRSSLSRLMLSTCVPTVLSYHSTGISTCCPSDTDLSLSLGPDLPRADQLYSGNLRYSAWRIPTSISLLIPAFSLPVTPLLLIGTASPPSGMLLYRSYFRTIPRLRCRVSAPDIFGAGPLD